MKCSLFRGTWQVGGAVARALTASEVCDRLTLLGRRTNRTLGNHAKVEQIVVDTKAADFEDQGKQGAQGHDVGIRCIGVRAARPRGSRLSSA